MNVPGWWSFLLLAGAAFRAWHLLAEDTILDRPRDWLAAKLGDSWDKFLLCAWCSGAYCALAWWLAWQVWPHGALVAATPFALSAAVGLAASRLGSD